MVPRLLVLGAGGFLGRSIARQLAGSGTADVVLHTRRTGDQAGLTDGFETRTLDLLDSEPGSVADMVGAVGAAFASLAALAGGAAAGSCNVRIANAKTPANPFMTHHPFPAGENPDERNLSHRSA